MRRRTPPAPRKMSANGLSLKRGVCRMSCGSWMVLAPASSRQTRTVANTCGCSAGMITVMRETGTPARCRQRAGVPVSRMTVIIPALHPQVFATVLVWRDDAGARTIQEPHDILHTPRFKDSPFALILRGAGGVRRRIERPDSKLDFPVVRDLKAENATDYVAMPFRFSDGQLNVMSMTSFAPGGFSTDHLAVSYTHLTLPTS